MLDIFRIYLLKPTTVEIMTIMSMGKKYMTKKYILFDDVGLLPV